MKFLCTHLSSGDIRAVPAVIECPLSGGANDMFIVSFTPLYISSFQCAEIRRDNVKPELLQARQGLK